MVGEKNFSIDYMLELMTKFIAAVEEENLYLEQVKIGEFNKVHEQKERIVEEIAQCDKYLHLLIEKGEIKLEDLSILKPKLKEVSEVSKKNIILLDQVMYLNKVFVENISNNVAKKITSNSYIPKTSKQVEQEMPPITLDSVI